MSLGSTVFHCLTSHARLLAVPDSGGKKNIKKNNQAEETVLKIVIGRWQIVGFMVRTLFDVLVFFIFLIILSCVNSSQLWC